MKYRFIKVSELVYFRLMRLKYKDGLNSRRVSLVISDLLDFFDKYKVDSIHENK